MKLFSMFWGHGLAIALRHVLHAQAQPSQTEAAAVHVIIALPFRKVPSAPAKKRSETRQQASPVNIIETVTAV